ncbi:MAG TPA: dipeptidase [Phycisphaerae bacterium]|nr:dipeptidase [Phycisphaerae bacterium]
MLESVLVWIEKNKHSWLDDLKQWLSFPSISADPARHPDISAAADWAMYYLRGAGLESSLVPTARCPCVLATTPDGLCPADAPHVLLYGHYDVQPPEPLEKWISPPFSPTVREGKIFARGASDDKGQVFCHLAALTAWKQIAHEIPVRLTVLLEGEEEIGSVNLPGVIRSHADQLKNAHVVIISDSSQFAPGVPAITCGLRGLIYYLVNLQGTKEDLHSGVYGGAVANPANALAQMLGGLHDARGRVTIPGFYDDVLEVDPELRRQWAALPFDEAQFAESLGVEKLYGEYGYSALQRRWCRPTLDINGLTSGYQGPGAKTVLPCLASAKVSMRLVPNQDPQKIAIAFEEYLRQLKPPGIKLGLQQLGASPAALTPIDSPAVAAAAEAVREGFLADPVFVREGGSIPVVTWFKELLGLDSVLLGFGLPDDNLHAPNEKLDLDCFYNGIRTAAALYDLLAKRLK